MRFMCLVKSDENANIGPPPPALFAAMDTLAAEATKAGVMGENGGLMPSATGFRVAFKKDKLALTDGPFAEAKEVVGGYAFFTVKTKDEIVYWSRRFMDLHKEHWPEWDGELEARQIMDGTPHQS